LPRLMELSIQHDRSYELDTLPATVTKFVADDSSNSLRP